MPTTKKYWKTSDGVKIPHKTNPERKEWDKRFFDAIVEKHAYGRADRLVPVRIPVSEHSMGHFVQSTDTKGPKGKGDRYRVPTYIRMLFGKDRLPPIVVRRNGIGWTVLDGNARMRAALEHGKTQFLEGYELLDLDKVPKVKKSEDDSAADRTPTSEPLVPPTPIQ